MAHELGESDWGDWLPRAVSDAQPDTVALWYLGCNGVILKGSGGTTVFIDPYLGLGDPPRTVRMVPVPFAPTDIEAADAVLSTHEHSDHVHGPTVGPILAGTGADYYAPDDCLDIVDAAGWIEEWEFSESQVTEIAEGESFEVGEFTVRVEPANDPDATHPVSYVLEHESGTFFHGGDARPGAAFESVGERYDIDLGVLAFGSSGTIRDKRTREPTFTTWYSDENEVTEAARQLNLDRLLPSHWDIWKGLTADPTALHEHLRSFEHPRSLEIVEIGDRIDL